MSNRAEWIRRDLHRLLTHAVAAGAAVPDGLEPTEVVVFYRDRRPVDALVCGTLPNGETWATDPAPRWATDGGLLRADRERPHAYARADGSGGFRERTPAGTNVWAMLGLAESVVELPEDLQLVARLVLGRLADDGEEGAAYALTDAGAPFRDRLVREMKRRLRELRRHVGMDGWPETVPEAAPKWLDGTFLTEAAAKWLAETFKTEGAESAAELRRRSGVDPWAPWEAEDGEDFAFILRRLVRLVWRNGMEAEAERARRNRPGLVREVYADELVAAQTAQLSLPTMEPRELRDRRGRLVATIDASVTDLPLVHAGIAALRSPMGNRMVKSFVLTAHRKKEAGEALFNRVQYDGGWSGLAEAVGHSGRDLSDLKALAKMGQHVNWQSRDGTHRGGGWWTWTEKRGGPGAPGYVRFSLADCFVPGFASSLKRDDGHALSAREARRLVPELPYEPPTGAVNERSQGAVWTLHRLFLVDLVDRAEELARTGLVVVSEDRWKDLAKLSGLPLRLLPHVLNSWTEGESEKAPKMVERDGDGWRLALDVYRLEHEFLVDGGRKRIESKAGGRKGGKKG